MVKWADHSVVIDVVLTLIVNLRCSHFQRWHSKTAIICEMTAVLRASNGLKPMVILIIYLVAFYPAL